MNRDTYYYIENITDPALFEQLVTELLIAYDKRYLCLNNMGINVQGKTIKAPIDVSGVMQENNISHFLYIENTITDLKSLKNKWLNENETDNNPLGDLIKAMNKVNADKKDFPNDKFTIYLACNRRKDDAIDKEVRKKAQAKMYRLKYTGKSFGYKY